MPNEDGTIKSFYKVVGDERVSITIIMVGLYEKTMLSQSCMGCSNGARCQTCRLEPQHFQAQGADQGGRHTMKVTMTRSRFINGLDSANLQRGRLQQSQQLSLSDQKELFNVSGCFHWAAAECCDSEPCSSRQCLGRSHQRGHTCLLDIQMPVGQLPRSLARRLVLWLD